MAGPLVEIVRSVVSASGIPEELEALLAQRTARAAAAWPGVTVDATRFVRAIAERLAADAPGRSLDAMQTDDLYLACGCATGDAGALAAFEQRYGPLIARAVAAVGASSADRADLGQVVRQRLLVAPAAGELPRIASFSARGSLQAWVRVVATREASRMLPRAHREVAADDDDLISLLATGDDPEIGYLKRLYHDELKRAFRAAVESLDDRDRLLLRQHALDGLSVDQLAALHGVHRATAARWVQAARDAVAAGTQRELIRRLRLSRGELASVLRLIRSQLDLSVSRMLRR